MGTLWYLNALQSRPFVEKNSIIQILWQLCHTQRAVSLKELLKKRKKKRKPYLTTTLWYLSNPQFLEIVERKKENDVADYDITTSSYRKWIKVRCMQRVKVKWIKVTCMQRVYGYPFQNKFLSFLEKCIWTHVCTVYHSEIHFFKFFWNEHIIYTLGCNVERVHKAYPFNLFFYN